MRSGSQRVWTIESTAYRKRALANVALGTTSSLAQPGRCHCAFVNGARKTVGCGWYGSVAGSANSTGHPVSNSAAAMLVSPAAIETEYRMQTHPMQPSMYGGSIPLCP